MFRAIAETGLVSSTRVDRLESALVSFERSPSRLHRNRSFGACASWKCDNIPTSHESPKLRESAQFVLDSPLFANLTIIHPFGSSTDVDRHPGTFRTHA